MAISIIDIGLLCVLLAGMAIGMFRGLAKQTLSIVIVYAAVVLAGYSYRWASEWVGSVANNPGALANSAAFVMLLGLIIVGFESLIHQNYSHLDLKVLGGFNQIGGMLAGFLWAALCTVFLLLALSFSIDAGSWGPAENVRLVLNAGVDGSALAHFYRDAYGVFVHSLSVWFPRGLPPLLNLGPTA